MGNIVGTVSFDQVKHHRFHKLVTDLMIKHNLSEPDPNNLEYTGKHRDHYGVEISGFLLGIIERPEAKRRIQKFLDEAHLQLLKAGATNIKIHLEDLPM